MSSLTSTYLLVRAALTEQKFKLRIQLVSRYFVQNDRIKINFLQFHDRVRKHLESQPIQSTKAQNIQSTSQLFSVRIIILAIYLQVLLLRK